MRFLPIER